MIPVLTPPEMAAVDAAAPEPVEVLVQRAGWAVARAALGLLGGGYGRRVVVVAGPGNNGADGREAARLLARRGVRCRVIDARRAPAELPRADLVVDAAFGTGLSRPWRMPRPAAGTPVLAVDIPSGVDGSTGARRGEPVAAVATVTFAALKPGLVFEPGRSLAGRVELVDIGLDVGGATCHVVEDGDVARWVPRRRVDAHKWCSAVRLVAGSVGMTGAAHLAARGALRAGAGYVQLASPGLAVDPGRPTEVVGLELAERDWASAAGRDLGRIGALVVGPGLGPGHDADVATLLAVAAVPAVVDGDALTPEVVGALARRPAPTVVTPHDGEWARLGGDTGPDRLAATREAARRWGVVVVRKGPTTVVADPAGDARLVVAGDPRLATAGTGDVLAGMIGAFVARGASPFDAAAAAAHLHGLAGRLGAAEGLVAGDLAELVPRAWATVRAGAGGAPG